MAHLADGFYLFVRLWPGFSGTFPYADFDATPDAELWEAIQQRAEADSPGDKALQEHAEHRQRERAERIRQQSKKRTGPLPPPAKQPRESNALPPAVAKVHAIGELKGWWAPGNPPDFSEDYRQQFIRTIYVAELPNGEAATVARDLMNERAFDIPTKETQPLNPRFGILPRSQFSAQEQPGIAIRIQQFQEQAGDDHTRKAARWLLRPVKEIVRRAIVATGGSVEEHSTAVHALCERLNAWLIDVVKAATDARADSQGIYDSEAKGKVGDLLYRGLNFGEPRDAVLKAFAESPSLGMVDAELAALQDSIDQFVPATFASDEGRVLYGDLQKRVNRFERWASVEPPGESSIPLTVTPQAMGYMGSAELAKALGVHPTRQGAFEKKLERYRDSKKLEDGHWIENNERQQNKPLYLYRADSPKVRELAEGYRAEKPKG